MPSTYSSLKIQLMATGENTTTWGNVTNTNLGTALEEAIVGSADVAFSNANVTLTLTDTNSTQSARNMRLNLTGTATAGYNLVVPAIEKPYIINNSTDGTITVKNTTGTGIAVPAGKTMWVFNNATNVVDVATHLTSVTLGSALVATSGGTGQNTYVIGDILYASTTTALSKLADVAVGNALISGGIGTAPSYGKIGLTTHVSGTLPVANGGTGTTTAFTAGSVVFAGASGVYTQDNAKLFWDNANDRLGIGTATPTSLLDVNGNAEIAGTLFLGASNHGNLGSDATQLFVRGNNIAFQNAAGSATYVYVNSTGNVGIGTSTPEAVLDMTGGQVTRGDASGYVYFAPKIGTTPFGVNYDRFEIRVDPGNPVTILGNTHGGTGVARALAFLAGTNERFRILTTGGITSSDLPNAVGYKGVPQSTNTTAAVGDIGKHIYVSTSVTINASVFSAGDSFVIVNSNTATTSINIIAGTNVTLRLAGTTTSGTPRPITPNGMASVLCVVGGANPVFLVSGAGVS